MLRILWLVPAMDRLWSDPPEARRRFLDRVTLSLYPDHADLALTYEKAMRERNRLLKDGIHDPGCVARTYPDCFFTDLGVPPDQAGRLQDPRTSTTITVTLSGPP